MDQQPHDAQEPGRFRFRRSAMDRIVGDRELMVRQAEARAETAERRAEELEEQLEGLRREAERSREQAEELRARLETARAEAGGGEASSKVSAEVRRILEAAEETAAEILEGARTEADRRRREAEELWADVQGQVARLAEWRAELEPRMEGVRGRLSELGRLVGEVPDRIQEALEPLAEALREGGEEVRAIERQVHPPLLVAPGSEQQEAPAGEDRPAAAEDARDAGDIGAGRPRSSAGP